MKTETSMQYSERVAREQAARNEAIGHPVGSFHGTVNPDLYTAKVDSIISLCREWQNGTITWAVLLLRADVSESGAEILRSIGRGDDNAALAKTARQAVAA